MYRYLIFFYYLVFFFNIHNQHLIISSIISSIYIHRTTKSEFDEMIYISIYV